MMVLKSIEIFFHFDLSTPGILHRIAVFEEAERKRESEGGNYMTDSQIKYRQLVETIKHDREQEANWMRSLGETIRHDQAQETLSKYQADTSAATSRYSADTSAHASIMGSALKADSTKYSADQSSGASRYKTDVEHGDRQARLAFDKYNQAFQNEMTALQYKLNKLNTETSVAKQNQEILKMQNDIEVALQNLDIAAKQLHLNELRVEAQNALDRARKWEAYTKTGMNVQQITRTIAIDAANIVKLVGNKLKAAKNALGSPNDTNIPDDFFDTTDDDKVWSKPSTGGTS